MALLDFLKNKEDAEKSKKGAKKPAKTSVAKPEAKNTEKKAVKEDAPAKTSTTIKAGKFSYEAIKQPHISEKASFLSEKDQYIFEVSPNYNKTEIRKSVEGIYGVDVLSVNVVKIPAKKRRLGKTEGFRKAYKKAIVKIKEGQKIEIL
jgi:large subunit ribosomal protein L23